MTALLTGWSGPALAVSASGFGGGPRDAAAASRIDEVTYSVRRGHDGTIALTAAVADVIVRKTVSPDGQAAVTVERDGDLVSIVSARTTIVVSRGPDSVLVNVVGGHDEQLSRVRQLLLGSAAVRGFRTVATVLDESGSQSPEKLALRFTGALVAQLDGEEGAVRRLSRELQASYGRPHARDVRPGLREMALSLPQDADPTTSRGSAPSAARESVSAESQARATPADCWRRYQAGVLKIAETLEASLSSFSFVNPMRLVCSFVFLMQVESLWVTYLSESSGLLL
jgi:hypothetical protein